MATALALADRAYAAPTLAYTGEMSDSEDVFWWIVVVWFAYAVALAYVACFTWLTIVSRQHRLCMVRKWVA